MTNRCTMSFDAPVFYVKSYTLHSIDPEEVRSARVYAMSDPSDGFLSTIIAFCDKDGFYLRCDNPAKTLISGATVISERPMRSLDADILNLAYRNGVLLDRVKVEKDSGNPDYWKVTVGSLLV